MGIANKVFWSDFRSDVGFGSSVIMTSPIASSDGPVQRLPLNQLLILIFSQAPRSPWSGTPATILIGDPRHLDSDALKKHHVTAQEYIKVFQRNPTWRSRQ